MPPKRKTIAAAAEQDTSPARITVEYDGRTLTARGPDDIDWRLLAKADSGDFTAMLAFLTDLYGQDTIDSFDRFTANTASDLMNAWTARIGGVDSPS